MKKRASNLRLHLCQKESDAIEQALLVQCETP
jgi:hypothetical protein